NVLMLINRAATHAMARKPAARAICGFHSDFSSTSAWSHHFAGVTVTERIVFVNAARPIARVTTKTGGPKWITVPTHAGLPPGARPSRRTRRDTRPEIVPSVARLLAPHTLDVNKWCGATRTIRHAATHTTTASKMPADARESHSRSLSSRRRLESPAKSANAAKKLRAISGGTMVMNPVWVNFPESDILFVTTHSAVARLHPRIRTASERLRNR